MILVLLGPPGSGKGTQAKRLAAEKQWPQLSTGDMFRAAIASKTALGLEAQSYIDKGQLVPDAVTVSLIRERIKAVDCASGFILDGFPRTVPQAQSLDDMLQSAGRKVKCAVLMEIADSELVRRLSGRRTCPKCSAMYHVETVRPKKDGICDVCGTALTQRADDHVDVIRKRLEVYHLQTAPVSDFYKKQNKLKILDASVAPEKVAVDLKHLLEA